MPMVRIIIRMCSHKFPPKMCDQEGNSDWGIGNICICVCIHIYIFKNLISNFSEQAAVELGRDKVHLIWNLGGRSNSMRRLEKNKRGQVRIRKFKCKGRHRLVSSFITSMSNSNTETLHYHRLGIRVERMLALSPIQRYGILQELWIIAPWNTHSDISSVTSNTSELLRAFIHAVAPPLPLLLYSEGAGDVSWFHECLCDNQNGIL